MRPARLTKMGADEDGTHERLKAHPREPVDPKIEEHHGRTVCTGLFAGGSRIRTIGSAVGREDFGRCLAVIKHGDKCQTH